MERLVLVLGLDIDATKTDRVVEVSRDIYVAATRARPPLVVVGNPEDAAALGFGVLAAQ